MKWIKKGLVAVAIAVAVSSCSKPYSPLDKTEWIYVDQGARLEIGKDGKAEWHSDVSGKTIELTYTSSESSPGWYDFKFAEDTDEKKAGQLFFQLDASRFDPKAERNALYRGLDQSEGNAYVSKNGESEKRYEENLERLKKDYSENQEKEKRLLAQTSIDDAPRDPAKYLDVVAEYGRNWATYVVLSTEKGKTTTDEDKLGMLSTKWLSTQDSFERQAMKAEEVAAIDSKVAAIQKSPYVWLPIGIGEDWAWAGLDKGYDFDKKGFVLTGTVCSGGMQFLNGNAVKVVVSDRFGADVCFLPVPDEATAKAIEQVRTSSSVGAVKGKGLYKIGPVDGNTVVLLPVGAVYEVGDWQYGKNKTPLYSTTVWGTPRPIKH